MSSSASQNRVQQRYYKERDLAVCLGVSVKTVQGWRFRSQGPPWVKITPGCIRYPIEAFERWAAERMQGGGGAR